MFKCVECKNEEICTKCLNSFFVNQTFLCDNCSIGCIECKTKDLCLKCLNPLFYLKDNKCLNCPLMCQDGCIDNKGCIKCKNGFYTKDCIDKISFIFKIILPFVLIGIFIIAIFIIIICFFLKRKKNRNESFNGNELI